MYHNKFPKLGTWTLLLFKYLKPSLDKAHGTHPHSSINEWQEPKICIYFLSEDQNFKLKVDALSNSEEAFGTEWAQRLSVRNHASWPWLFPRMSWVSSEVGAI